MRHVAQPHFNMPTPEACAAPMRGWIILVLGWLFDALDALPPPVRRCPFLRDWVRAAKAAIATDLREAVRALRVMLVAFAYARMRFTTGRIHQVRYPGAPRGGMRHARRLAHFYRRATAGIVSGMHEGALRQRAKRLGAAFDTLDALIARVVKRLTALWRFPHRARLVLTSARDICTSVACAPVCVTADTS